jgi:hypothetical protein
MNVLHLLGGMILVAALSGCGVVKLRTTKLYVEKGPLAASHPDLVVGLKSKWTNNEGIFKYTLPDGAMCTGNWSLKAGKTPKSSTVNTTMLARGSGWVAKGGSISTTGDGGTVVDHGNRNGLGVGAGDCSDGTTFEFAFVADGLHAKGALQDSRGNVFAIIR